MWQRFLALFFPRKPKSVAPPKPLERRRNYVSLYGCLDDGEEREYPPEESIIKFLRNR